MELESLVLLPVQKREPPRLPDNWYERLERLRREQRRGRIVVDDGEPLQIPRPEIPYDRKGPTRDYSAQTLYQPMERVEYETRRN